MILSIFKKDDRRIYANYRGILLIRNTVKLYESILENTLKEQTRLQLEDSQSGFRKG